MFMAKVTDKSVLHCLCHQGHKSSGGSCTACWGERVAGWAASMLAVCVSACCSCWSHPARNCSSAAHYSVCMLCMQPLASRLQVAQPTQQWGFTHSNGVLLTSSPPGGSPHPRRSLWWTAHPPRSQSLSGKGNKLQGNHPCPRGSKGEWLREPCVSPPASSVVTRGQWEVVGNLHLPLLL